MSANRLLQVSGMASPAAALQGIFRRPRDQDGTRGGEMLPTPPTAETGRPEGSPIEVQSLTLQARGLQPRRQRTRPAQPPGQTVPWTRCWRCGYPLHAFARYCSTCHWLKCGACQSCGCQHPDWRRRLDHRVSRSSTLLGWLVAGLVTLAWRTSTLEGDGGVWVVVSQNLATPVGPAVAALAVVALLWFLLGGRRRAQHDQTVSGLASAWTSRGANPSKWDPSEPTETGGSREAADQQAEGAPTRTAAGREGSELLHRAQAAALRGDRAGARRLLLQAAELDPTNETTWLWLAGVTEEPEQAITCLEQVLLLDPNNLRALQGLEEILERYAGDEIRQRGRAS